MLRYKITVKNAWLVSSDQLMSELKLLLEDNDKTKNKSCRWNLNLVMLDNGKKR